MVREGDHLREVGRCDPPPRHYGIGETWCVLAQPAWWDRPIEFAAPPAPGEVVPFEPMRVARVLIDRVMLCVDGVYWPHTAQVALIAERDGPELECLPGWRASAKRIKP